MFVVNVEGAVLKDDKWLMIVRGEKEEHAAGGLALVGGQVDHEGFSSDILERTIEREMMEEVGLEVSVLGYVSSSSFISDSNKHVVDVVFLCKIDSGNAYAKSEDEVETIVWKTTDEIVEDETLPDYLKNNIVRADELARVFGLSVIKS